MNSTRAWWGAEVGEVREITAVMAEDHTSEQVRGKEVTFRVEVVGIQERMLPEWEELPLLEEAEGTLEELREQTRQSIAAAAQSRSEQRLLDQFMEQVIAETTYDVPDVLLRETAEDILENQAQQYTRYGVTLDQMLAYRNQTRDEAIDELLPMGEETLRMRLALQEIVRAEYLDVSEEELQHEMLGMLQQLSEQQVQAIVQKQQVSTQFMYHAANSVLDRKLRERLVAIARGAAPDLAELAAAQEQAETAELEAETAEPMATDEATAPDASLALLETDATPVASTSDATITSGDGAATTEAEKQVETQAT